MPIRSLRFGRVLAGIVATLAVTCATAFGAAVAPVATTGAASSLTYQSAVLAATVNPKSAATEVYFQYGTSTAYGAESTTTALPAGTATVSVTASIASLGADTTYDYRVVAVSANGTTDGANRTFTTAKIPLTLAITADPNPVSYGGVVTIEGTLAGTGNGNQPVALQENPFPYTAGFTQVGNTELTTSTGAYAFTIGVLLINTEFRVVNVDKPSVVSAVVDEGDAVAATFSAHALGSKKHPEARFSGTVAPGIETDAKIAISEYEGTTWKLVGGTITSNSTSGGVAKYSVTVHFHHAGFFRLFVTPVEGTQVFDQSAPIYVRGYSG
jgi:hypothetical protein